MQLSFIDVAYLEPLIFSKHLLMKFLLRLGMLLLHAAGIAQIADSLWIVNNYTNIERSITMRDVVKLFTFIYVDKDNF